MLGIESYEAVLISSQPGKMLYSDDERLRSLARGLHGTQGVWTQLLIMELLNEKVITKQRYAEATLKLINSNYNYTSINKDVLIEAARQASWKLEKPLLQLWQSLERNLQILEHQSR